MKGSTTSYLVHSPPPAGTAEGPGTGYARIGGMTTERDTLIDS